MMSAMKPPTNEFSLPPWRGTGWGWWGERRSTAKMMLTPGRSPIREEGRRARANSSFSLIACVIALGLLYLLPHGVLAQAKKKPDPPAEKPAAATETDDAQPEAPADEETAELPKLDKMELPSFQRLMEGPAIDWIVLVNQKVLEVEPL